MTIDIRHQGEGKNPFIIKHSSTEIKRYVKVKGKASPMTETGFTEYKNGYTLEIPAEAKLKTKG